MAQKSARKVRTLGATRSYTDGSEDAVRAVLEAAADRSDGSDELNRHATDWGTTYHLSPRRSNLVRPFIIGPEHRVLEVGAGTGAITRHLGERGAQVVALEGDRARADAIAVRCADLDNVEVICGALEELEDSDGFDLVVVIGVLEYAGGADDAAQVGFLRHAAGLMKPDGALLIAIENRIGLKYLLGYSEDHLGVPWAGVEGYPGDPPVRTFSRPVLADLLERAGLPEQRWYFPYPDYKLPKTILHRRLFDHPRATVLVDQLVGDPIQDLASPPTRFSDHRSSHLSFLEAGLGPDIANSFLVLAAGDGDATRRFVRDEVVAWHFSSERRRRWRRVQLVAETGDGLSLSSSPVFRRGEPSDEPWLRHVAIKDEPFLAGRTLEQRALDACRRYDLEALGESLKVWHEHLAGFERDAGDADHDPHPFLTRADRRRLPPEFLDVSLSNFVDTGDRIAFIDREWHAGTSVDATLVRFRALWYFALELVTSGVAQPFDPTASVNAITERLSRLIGLDPAAGLIDELVAAEAALQHVVTGRDVDRTAATLRELGSLSRADQRAASTLPVSQIRRDTVQLGAMLESMRGQIDDARGYQADLEGELGRLKARIAELEALVAGKDGWAAELASSLEANETMRRQVVEELERSTGWARSLDRELEQVSRRAAELEQQIAGKDAWAAELEKQIAGKDAWTAELGAAIGERDAALEAATTELERTAAWARQLDEQLRVKERLLAEHESSLAEAAEKAHRLLTGLERTESERVALGEELDRVARWAGNLERDNVDKTERLARIEDELQRTGRQLGSLQSWKDRVSDLRLVRIALAVHRLLGGPGTGV